MPDKKTKSPARVAGGCSGLPGPIACRGDDIVPSGRSCAAAITSSMTLNPASICTLITVRAGGAFGTYRRYARFSTSYSIRS